MDWAHASGALEQFVKIHDALLGIEETETEDNDG